MASKLHGSQCWRYLIISDIDTDDVEENNQGKSNNNTPPKGKRSRSQEPGETAAPPLTVDKDEVCSIDNPGEDWRFKCYIDFHHTELELYFVTTRYRREHYQTPEGNVTAPLPAHVKGRFGDLSIYFFNFFIQLPGFYFLLLFILLNTFLDALGKSLCMY